MNKNSIVLIVIFLILSPTLACAWWDDSWSSRKQITVDTTATGADLQENLQDFPMLVRLHTGNFGYFAELADNGRDLRFMLDDDKPLQYEVEQVDVLNERGLIWVRLPSVRSGVSSDNFWLYYGNAAAVDGSDSRSVYDMAQSLVYHFVEGQALPQDATAYASHAADSKAEILGAGWLGAAAKFNGAGPITIKPAPQLAISPEKGWTFSSWVKIEQPQANAYLLVASDGSSNLTLTIQGTTLSAKGFGATIPASLRVGSWQLVAVVIKANSMQLYLDGMLVASSNIKATAFTPTVLLGQQFTGFLDEVQIAATARNADWLKLSFRSQSPDFSVLSYSQDESNSTANTQHLQVIIDNVTLDGWLVIALIGIMLAIAIMVMMVKALVIRRISRLNRVFLRHYKNLNPKKLTESDCLSTLLNKREQFQGSTLYSLYELALLEQQKLTDDLEPDLLPEAWQLLKVKLDGQIAIDTLRLNKHMVLLTIAIAGGPFLGLLGTVMGVMITFAEIAATGDVNINTIAPGIAAALLATVAGLMVAIPSLFAYNYLLTQIKATSINMRMFADEFLAVLHMQAARRLKATS